MQTHLGEGNATNRPPLFNGTHYRYWKIRMQVFLESQSLDVWNIVEEGYVLPTTLEKDSEGIVTSIKFKPKSAWTQGEKDKANLNAKAKNSLYCALSQEEFNRVVNCNSAKEVWETLETTHEGTDQVKIAKIQMLTSKFEDIKMLEEETFDEFYTKIMEIVNSLVGLGEKMNESKTVRKILRSLPKRFKPKIVAITESKNVDNIKIEELRGNLLTYELDFEVPSKKKGVALSSQHKENDNESESDEDTVLLTKKVKNFFKNRKNFKISDESRSEKFQRNSRRSFIKKDVQCYNCK